MKPVLSTARTHLVVLQPEHAALLLNYYSANQAHLAQWEPERSAHFYTLAYWQSTAKQNVAAQKAGSALHCAATTPDFSEVVGVCNLTNIAYGVFQACHLGYSIAEAHQGVGLMTEIVDACVSYAFSDLGLHRVMANHMPANTRSERLLKKLGFEREGLAKSYLKINGRWEDHVLTAKINPTNT